MNRQFEPLQSLSPIEAAVWRTLAYADLFDYPMTAGEIHRYLEGIPATLQEVVSVLEGGLQRSSDIVRCGDCFALAGRDEIISLRRQRTEAAQRLWPLAKHYGLRMAALPYVRMVALTGSLAMGNAEEGADMDFLIVSQNDRLWICRAFTILQVRLAARRGHRLCPNYFLSERALKLHDCNLYTAHEVTQMIPLYGREVYQRLRKLNRWTEAFLPNAAGEPARFRPEALCSRMTWHWMERPFQTPLGTWLERWEMRRKIQRFEQYGGNRSETRFSADCCKGHFGSHRNETLNAYHALLGKQFDRGSPIGGKP